MMQSLKFLGRGGAFNTEEGNTSAYFIKDNILFILDCGETVFATLKENDKLINLISEHNITDIQIYITHLHSDHVGSLSSLIYYCYYVLNIKPKVHHPQKVRGEYVYFLLNQLLRIQGHKDEYEFEKDTHKDIYPQQVEHADGINSYCYMIHNLNGKNILYTGDCSELPASVVININNGWFHEVYVECASNESPVHLSLKYLDDTICRVKEIRDRVYLMHIDKGLTDRIASVYGFKVVELDV